MSTTNSTTTWSISTDIYDIVNQVNTLEKTFLPDETETTLAVGIFGFLASTESKKIQTATVIAGESGNEQFATRAKLDKNIVTHAVYCGITDINAVPASMTIALGIRVADLDTYMKSNEFVFDHTCPIYAGDYEFHLDYDIILTRAKRNGVYVYNAYYDMTKTNILSTISNAYLKPYVLNYDNYSYVFVQAVVRQLTIETTEDTMITASIIDNKTFSFSFTNQLAGFDVYVTENNTTTRLTPYFYGSAVGTGVINYCWYLYMNDDTIRITFDNSSYIPGLNADVKIIAYTTLGKSGNFQYKSTVENAGFYVDFTSTYYSNKKITCHVDCLTDSRYGTDMKSTADLKALIPKMALSRGYITTETDLNGYFNLISTDSQRMKMQKKVDNQLQRIWYCYLLTKDNEGNIIPTNTLPIQVNLTESYVIRDTTTSGKYVIPCGTTFVYDPTVGYCTYIAEADIPTKYSTSYFGSKYYYRLIHNIVISTNPLYCSYYNTLVNFDDYFEYNYVNESMEFGFIANTDHFERSLLSNKNEYRLTFTITQSVNSDYGLYTTSTVNGQTVVTNNMKVFLVIYKSGVMYRYTEAEIQSFDSTTYASSWKVTLTTDNEFDTSDCMKILDLFEVGSSTSKNYGYFEDQCEAYIYICGKFDSEYGRDKIDKIVPNLTGYSLINIYQLANGIRLFRNYSAVTNTRIRENTSEDLTVVNYDISGIPLVGEHYFMSESKVTELMNIITEKKAYIDNCLAVLENNMEIDFKFYNTYGYSYTYVIGEESTTSLGNIDTTWEFKLKLVNTSDSTTKDSIINYIKDYVENLDETADLHIPNLLHDIKEQYNDLITYIEFVNYNGLNLIGLNHIILLDDITAKTVPEFINIRNGLSTDGSTLIPDITIDIVTT